MGMVNTTVVLKPRDQWRPGMTFEKLQAEMDAQLHFPAFRMCGHSRYATDSTCC
jgi:Cu(I)/Ag(I) efflux system membrane protein CusA/SilA